MHAYFLSFLLNIFCCRFVCLFVRFFSIEVDACWVFSGTDQWSLAAQRLYTAISTQGQYSSEHALELLLKEVAQHKDADITADGDYFSINSLDEKHNFL